MAGRGRVIVGFALMAGLTLSGCATTAERIAYTADESARAEVAGLTNVRFPGDASASVFDRLQSDVVRQAKARHETVSYLALSGGGGDGAYGAGFLSGLRQTGRRPQFTIVSGVSTGALMAPFVFLGPDYEEALKELYTSGDASTLVKDVNILNGLFGNALVDSDKLLRFIKRSIDDTVLQRVANEHRKGRRLLIATTNIDAQKSEVWDMGAIAASGAPNALALFQQVLAASASVPGLFPPRLIDVTADGHAFKEMHVDGGTLRQLYIAPDDVVYGNAGTASGIKDLYVLVNNKIDPTFDVVDNATVAVGARSLATILKREGRNNVMSAYAFAARNRIGYHLAFIDAGVRDLPADDPAKGFGAEYMTYLYGLGEAQGKGAQPWLSRPPLAQEPPIQQQPGAASSSASSAAPGKALIAPALGTGG